MHARIKFLLKALAVLIAIYAAPQRAFAHDPSKDGALSRDLKNGSIGVAHVIEIFEMLDSCGSRALVIVTTDEDFDNLSIPGRISQETPFLVDLVGYDYRLSLRRLNDGQWISGRVTGTYQRVYVITQKRAKYWH